MRSALGLSCIAGLGLASWIYSNSPAQVPIHYGPSGIADRWGSPLVVLIAHVCIIGLGSALFFALPELLRRIPEPMINLPNKAYWWAPERRDVTAAKFASWSYAIGTALNLNMITLQLLLTDGTEPTRAPLLSTLAFLAFALCSSVGLVWSFRLPARPVESTSRGPHD